MKNGSTLAFLMSLLGAFLANTNDEECLSEVVTKSLTVIYSDTVKDVFTAIDEDLGNSVMETIGDVDKETIRNFLDGYKIAIEKYGLNRGNEKMREKLIEVIINNSPYTRDILVREARLTNISAKLMTDGIHIDTTGGET